MVRIVPQIELLPFKPLPIIWIRSFDSSATETQHIDTNGAFLIQSSSRSFRQGIGSLPEMNRKDHLLLFYFTAVPEPPGRLTGSLPGAVVFPGSWKVSRRFSEDCQEKNHLIFQVSQYKQSDSGQTTDEQNLWEAI